MDLVPGAACTSVLLLFPSSLSMSEVVVDIGVADFEPVKSDSSSCNEKDLNNRNITDSHSKTGVKMTGRMKQCQN